MEFIKKYSALLIGILLTAIAYLALGRPPKPKEPTPDSDRNGENDQNQIDSIQQQAQQHRDQANVEVNEAVIAVNRPVTVTPSNDVAEAVRRNNEVDY